MTVIHKSRVQMIGLAVAIVVTLPIVGGLGNFEELVIDTISTAFISISPIVEPGLYFSWYVQYVTYLGVFYFLKNKSEFCCFYKFNLLKWLTIKQ